MHLINHDAIYDILHRDETKPSGRRQEQLGLFY